VEAHLDTTAGIDKPWRRNAAIVWLDLALDQAKSVSKSNLSKGTHEVSSHENGQHLERTAIIVEYLQKYGNTSVAYEDIRPHAENLEPDERSELLEVLLKNTSDRSMPEASRMTLSPQNQKVRLIETFF
jgi:hypothetical protein